MRVFMTPEISSWFSKAVTKRFHALNRLALSLETIISPLKLSRRSMKISVVAPTLILECSLIDLFQDPDLESLKRPILTVDWIALGTRRLDSDASLDFNFDLNFDLNLDFNLTLTEL